MKPTTPLRGIIAARRARDCSCFEGLQKIIAKEGEDATQVKSFNAYLP
jgi:hypothetical protein